MTGEAQWCAAWLDEWECKMTSEEMDELLFSLAWCSWSAYHNENAKFLLKEHFPELDAEKQIKRFKNIITQKPQEGSPK